MEEDNNDNDNNNNNNNVSEFSSNVNQPSKELLGKKRKARKGAFLERKKEKKARLEEVRQKVDQYYEGYYHGFASAFAIFLIMRSIYSHDHPAFHAHLWYAVVGVTELHLAQKDTESIYDEQISELESTLAEIKSLSNRFAQHDVGSIDSDFDFRLMLFRHWNLCDSMQYSNYVGTRLGIWKNMRRGAHSFGGLGTRTLAGTTSNLASNGNNALNTSGAGSGILGAQSHSGNQNTTALSNSRLTNR